MLYLRPLLKYCFIILFGSMLVESGSFAAPSAGVESSETEQVFFSDDFAQTGNSPFHQPLSDETNELETQDETNPEEDSENKWNQLFLASSYSDYYCRLTDTSCSLHRKARLQNRTPVSLFILYHSWKSDPS